jgi:hypothetical protein
VPFANVMRVIAGTAERFAEGGEFREENVIGGKSFWGLDRTGAEDVAAGMERSPAGDAHGAVESAHGVRTAA